MNACRLTRLAVPAALALTGCAAAAEPPWSVRGADSVLARHPDPTRLDSEQPKWEYTHGLVLDALWRVGQETGTSATAGTSSSTTTP